MRIIKLDNDKVTLVFSTDWHLSAVAPGRRGDDYATSMLDKLKFISDLTHRLKGMALCGGDVFNIKSPKSEANNHGFIARVITALAQFPGGYVVGNTGNHDIQNDDASTAYTGPIGVLFAAGVYHDLVAEPVLFTNSDESVTVLVETFPYEHGGETLARLLATKPRPEGVTYRIGIVHAYGKPGNGGSMFGEPIIGYNQCAGLDYDFLCWGHDHSRKETVEVEGISHIHLGSLSRASLDTDQVDRPVSVAILSFNSEGVRYKEKEVPVKPLEIAFTTADKAVEKVAKSDEIKNFFIEMDSQVEDIESEDPQEILKTICPEEDRPVLDKVYELCEF